MSKGLVLVTGITGFVATDVALAFLREGYSVRGTARSAEKAKAWITLFPEFEGQFEGVIVADMSLPNAYDEAIKGVNYVAHVASPFTMEVKDNEKDMLIPALQGTKNIIAAIEKEPKVKHLVHTSSFAAILDLVLVGTGQAVNKVFKDDDWNPVSYEAAKASDNIGFVYCASKKLAEKVIWDYVEEKKPSWGVTTICPSMIYGPPMHFVKDMKELKTTAPIWQLIAGGLMEVPPTTSPVYVDVRDVALAHVRAVEIPVARNQRYMLNAGHFSFDQVAHLIRQKRLELASNVPSSEGLPPSPHFKTDSSKAERDLGIKFITFEKMILDTVDKLVQLNKSLAH